FQDSGIRLGSDAMARCRHNDPQNEMSRAVQKSEFVGRFWNSETIIRLDVSATIRCNTYSNALMDQIPWLLLLYSLPAHRNAQRVAVWRRFREIGALQLTTSTYLLPDQPAHYEHFQWLTKFIRDSGGEATLVRVREIEGMPNEKLVALFNEARDREYGAIRKSLRNLERDRTSRAEPGEQLHRLVRQFRDLRSIDFFNSSRGQEIEMQLQKLERTSAAKGALPKIHPEDYRERTWLTRPRPQIDRTGSAWLIRNFIDSKARFAFADKVSAHRKAVSFDMLEAEFSHV